MRSGSNRIHCATSIFACCGLLAGCGGPAPDAPATGDPSADELQAKARSGTLTIVAEVATSRPSVQRVVVEARPAGVVLQLAYDASLGAFAGRITVDSGLQLVTTTAFGPKGARIASATVAVPMNHAAPWMSPRANGSARRRSLSPRSPSTMRACSARSAASWKASRWSRR